MTDTIGRYLLLTLALLGMIGMAVSFVLKTAAFILALR